MEMITLTAADAGKSAEDIQRERGTLGVCHICQANPAITRHGPILICSIPACRREALWRYSRK